MIARFPLFLPERTPAEVAGVLQLITPKDR
jgi:hypothetical protein